MSCLVADVPYFIDPGKVVRDLQTSKMCFATMKLILNVQSNYTFFLICLLKRPNILVLRRSKGEILTVSRKNKLIVKKFLSTI